MTFRAIGYHGLSGILKGLGFLALLAAGGTAADAKFAPKTDAQLFADYVKAPSYRKYLLDAFNGTEPTPLKATCAKLDIVATDPPLVIFPPSFAQIGNTYPISIGRWVARATLNRCGAKVIRRLFLEVDPRNGELHAQALIPGEFPGNIKLENDTTKIVLPGVMGFAKCRDWKSLWVLDTKLKSPAKPQGWSETWTTQACGRTVTVDVVYTADATGMNIDAKNFKAR